MLYSDYTGDLLGLKDIIVTKVISRTTEIQVYLEPKLTMQVCPARRHETKRSHDYRTQVVKDVSLQGKHCLLYLRKRRYFRPHCGHVFLERLPFLPRYQRNTNRLVVKIMEDYRAEHSTTSISKRNGVSTGVATRILDRISYPLPKLPKVLSIDEFKGNACGRKFQCVLTDPVKRNALDILPSKNSEELISYFLRFPLAQRKEVEYLVMDMSLQFREVMTTCFPNAKVILYKFHVCRHITWAVENVRKEEQRKFTDARRKYFKRSRFLILNHQHKLTVEQHQQLENMLSVSPKLGEAYWLKELFYTFIGSKDLQEAKKNLANWNLCVGVVDLEKFTKCFGMINRWQSYILRAFSL